MSQRRPQGHNFVRVSAVQLALRVDSLIDGDVEPIGHVAEAGEAFLLAGLFGGGIAWKALPEMERTRTIEKDSNAYDHATRRNFRARTR